MSDLGMVAGGSIKPVNPFKYMKPSDANIVKIEAIRDAYTVLWELLLTMDRSREMSTAITHLETSAMWATKSLVFNEQ